MGGGGSKPAPAPVREQVVRSAAEWEAVARQMLACDDTDSTEDEEEDMLVTVIRYRRGFSEEWLFPSSMGTLAEARQEIILIIRHHRATMSFKDAFMVWKDTRRDTIAGLLRVAERLEKKQGDVEIAALSGSCVGFLGALLAFIGALLMPFTFGASFGLSVAGTAVCVAGGVTQVGATVADAVITKKEYHVVQELMEADVQCCKGLRDCLLQLGVTSGRLQNWAQEQHALTMGPMGYIRDLKAAGGVLRQTGNIVQFGVETAEQVSSLRVASTAASFSDDAVLLGTETGTAVNGSTRTAATAAGSSVTSGFAIAGSVVGMGVEVGMIAYLSHSIHNGSKCKTAADLREKVPVLRRELHALQQIYNTCGISLELT